MTRMGSLARIGCGIVVAGMLSACLQAGGAEPLHVAQLRDDSMGCTDIAAEVAAMEEAIASANSQISTYAMGSSMQSFNAGMPSPGAGYGGSPASGMLGMFGNLMSSFADTSVDDVRDRRASAERRRERMMEMHMMLGC